MLGVFLDTATVQRGDLDFAQLRAVLDEWEFHDLTLPEQFEAYAQRAQVFVSNKFQLSAAHIAAARQLKLICVAATGTNNVDLNAAKARGIAVCNVQNYATPSVVQHVFLLMLALTTRYESYRQLVKSGAWQKSSRFSPIEFPIEEIAGRTLGIVGYGTLGKAVARMAEAFGMRVLIAARPGTAAQAGRVPLRELLPNVDVLSLHCPLTAQTRGLIGANELALMRPSAFLINTARGGIVDEGALATALRARKLAGAGIDVLTQEPPVHGNPLLAEDIPNLIVTPHIAWASRESRQRLLDEVAENIRAFLRGEMRNRVV